MTEKTLLNTFVQVPADGLPEELAEYAKKGDNVIIVGEAGFGKTACVKEAFELAGFKKYLIFAGATMDPWVDLVGIPMKKTDEKGNSVLELVRPEGFADDTVEAIFLDEFNRAHKKVRNAVMELLQFKSINGHKFKNLKTVFAAVNPDDLDNKSGFARYDVEQIDPAQIDRFQVRLYLKSQFPLNYFKKRYGDTIATIANQWWQALTPSQRADVSPRRLDNAVEFFFKYSGTKPLNRVIQDVVTSQKLNQDLSKHASRLFLEEAYKRGDYETAAELIIAQKAFEPDSEVFRSFSSNKPFRNFVFKAAAAQQEILVSRLQASNFSDSAAIKHAQQMRTMAISVYADTKSNEVRDCLRKVSSSSSNVIREMLNVDPSLLSDYKPALLPADAEEFRIRQEIRSLTTQSAVNLMMQEQKVEIGCNNLIDVYLRGSDQTKDEALELLRVILSVQYTNCQRSHDNFAWFKTDKCKAGFTKMFEDLEIVDVNGLYWIFNATPTTAGIDSIMFFDKNKVFNSFWAKPKTKEAEPVGVIEFEEKPKATKTTKSTKDKKPKNE